MAFQSYLLVVYLCLSWTEHVTGQPCVDGYILNTNGTCVDQDECLTGPCGPYSICHNRIGGFHCTCQTGFASVSNQLLNGKTVSFCRDKDECLSDVCSSNATCHNTEGSFYCTCNQGFYSASIDRQFAGKNKSSCKDKDECLSDVCPSNATCHNTEGSFYCTCNQGFYSVSIDRKFAGKNKSSCIDYNECETYPTICGDNASCHNNAGSFYCTCHEGFARSNEETTFTGYGKGCQDVNECDFSPCGSHASCRNTVGSYICTCDPGFISSSGGNRMHDTDRCIKFDCPSDEVAKCSSATMETEWIQGNSSAPEHDDPTCSFISFFRAYNVCEKLHSQEDFDFEENLKNLTSLTEELLRNQSHLENLGGQDRQRALEVSLQTIESSVMALAYTLSDQEKKNMAFGNIEVEMEVLRGRNFTHEETASLSAKGNQMNIHWRAVTDREDSGFASVALIAFSEMESVLNGSLDSDGGLSLNSHVVTVTSSHKGRQALAEPVNITFRNEREKKPRVKVVCISLNRTRSRNHWSQQGCTVVNSNTTHTMCRCTHLTSFAVLMALYETQDPWHLLNLSLISYVGISISLVCLVISFLTFLICRTIQGTRTTIHAHLCLCLFLAELLFLVGISQTSNQLVCAIIAGFLHYFFLTVFAWMCLEGIQLYLMVVKVFNAGCLRKRHILPFGYGLPLLVVGISAAVRHEGYGTSKHCWLSLDKHFLWSFLGPVCAIIMINIVFYCITLVKLAKKMSSIQKDAPKLKMFRSFTVTAIAQLFLLGCTWIFGIFHFQKETITMAYIFTIINSLQGAFIFILHCLLNKQVRDEYRKWFPCCLKPILYSEFIQSSMVPMISLQSKNSSTYQIRDSSCHNAA
ncbi:adhesion G protein-coupled receptor E2-like isoform X4 [Hemiscyllium ocellatum]|uniref:adhesion G protein-coupled receptor E2-like isoform X4 n=1 Tax=Hemiscyllium ocellatum TaxID=170820 RepID=UPI002966A60C|nr:adhesion G protein-coupled receptor E2-like isoform X4 [Hemiscyllium ocellatum]